MKRGVTYSAVTVLALFLQVEPVGAVVVRTQVAIDNQTLAPSHATTQGIWFYSHNAGQVLLTGHKEVAASWQVTISIGKGQEARLKLAEDAPGGNVSFKVQQLSGATLECRGEERALVVRAPDGSGAVRLTQLRVGEAGLQFEPVRRPFSREPVTCSPDPHPTIAEALIEWDWRLSDGIYTPREPRTYQQAVATLLERMRKAGMDSATTAALMAKQPKSDDQGAWESYWLEAHRTRRKLLLQHSPVADQELLFVKHVPSIMSHQLTQVYGYCSRPGGGIFKLKAKPDLMETHDLSPSMLPAGNFMTPELSYDADKLLFAWCPVREAPNVWDRNDQTGHLYYHIYELTLSNGAVRQLTKGSEDNFFPVYLPSGDIVLTSTIRGGYHRCGRGPCNVYTLARMDGDGNNLRSISFHETQEWDPSILSDGRIVYTRWDYVDRDAVFYQQLWSARPDGSNVRIYYGNNTWNPAGVWEARAIPGSKKIMATASAHHAMSAGSVILLDVEKGVDGDEPLTRLTPDARFPETEVPLAFAPDPKDPYDFDTPVSKFWRASAAFRVPSSVQEPTVEELRWPGHCYKAPWPLSETLFLVSYSYDRLLGEPGPNIPNMFGIYLCDAYGNRELLYRDPNISSLWARPATKRSLPPEMPSTFNPQLAEKQQGTFFLSNVMESWPALPESIPITHLRVFQVLLKTTPHKDQPKVAMGHGASGRQVLGTVPVESDGSAYFTAPANTPIYLQALNSQGRAVQTMRSLIYLQPGETESCIGCHEHRMRSDPPRTHAMALKRAPSTIKPGPDGTKPFSFPRLVQPILDKHCVSCHDGSKKECPPLTAEAQGWASKAYNTLLKHIAYSGWAMPNTNYEPMSEPLRFGAINSPLAKRLDTGHANVRLSPQEWECLNIWMDANSAFYGTFDVNEQKKQLAGVVIEGPKE